VVIGYYRRGLMGFSRQPGQAAAMGDAFCASRLGARWMGAYGTPPAGVDFDAIIDRASPTS
jgi:hypothetical protein